MESWWEWLLLPLIIVWILGILSLCWDIILMGIGCLLSLLMFPVLVVRRIVDWIRGTRENED